MNAMDDLAYFARNVSYEYKMFMKSTIGVTVIKHFLVIKRKTK
jgi:hypothetical protein